MEINLMNILLIRDSFSNSCTLGKLFIDGTLECQSLEDPDRKLEEGRVKIYGESAIPRGTYKVTIDFSGRFQRDMPHVLDVPQFTGIRIHPGNTAADTDGCILVGTGRVANRSITESRLAFNKFFPKLEAAIKAGEEITLEIR